MAITFYIQHETLIQADNNKDFGKYLIHFHDISTWLFYSQRFVTGWLRPYLSNLEEDNNLCILCIQGAFAKYCV